MPWLKNFKVVGANKMIEKNVNSTVVFLAAFVDPHWSQCGSRDLMTENCKFYSKK
jgi:hypothetical protein